MRTTRLLPSCRPSKKSIYIHIYIYEAEEVDKADEDEEADELDEADEAGRSTRARGR